MDPYIGRFYSQNWIQRNVLMMTDDEIKTIESEIAKEGPPEPPEGEEEDTGEA
jgi:hypothetical protein